jgi:CHAT domain-containing protein/tetratricopeptide (TPR) repeat protein
MHGGAKTMPNSYFERRKFICPSCGQNFDFDLWLIVDAAERPDLFECILDGTLHTVTCVHCSANLGKLSAPLLLCQLGGGSPLIFSPADHVTFHQNQQHITILMNQLRVAVGNAQFKALMANGIRDVPRAILERELAELRLRQIMEFLGVDVDTFAEQLSKSLFGNGAQEASLELGGVPPDLVPIIQELRQPCLDVRERSHRIKLIRHCLARLTREGNPKLWASLQTDLAANLMTVPSGDRAETIEGAIYALKQALKVNTFADSPVSWATLQHNLGIAYCERIRGNRSENLEQAIECLRQASEIRTQADFPVEWAMAQNSLAIAYQKRVQGNRAENLEQAIQFSHNALAVYTDIDDQMSWALVHYNLGNQFRERIKGDKTENVEQSIYHHKQALTARTSISVPVDWANSQNGLGGAYLERLRGNRAENIEQAIHHLQQALEVRRRDSMPVEWAMTQYNLGFAYSLRLRGNRAENIEQAIHHLEQALEVRTQDSMPVEWAMTQNILVHAYSDRILGDRAQNLERAISHCQQSMEIFTYEDFPLNWAMLQHNLGRVYHLRIRGDHSENIEQAINSYERALAIRTDDAFPRDSVQTQRSLGDLYFGERRWNEALSTYKGAISVGDKLLQTSYSEAGRQAEVAKTAGLYSRAAFCLVQVGEYGAALVQLEAGKTRLLAEALAFSDADMAMLPAGQQHTLADLRQRIRALEAEYRLPPLRPTDQSDLRIVAELRDVRTNIDSLINTIRTEYPDFMPEGLDLPDIFALVPADGALVAPLLTSQGSAVFVVPPDVETVTGEHVIRLNDFPHDGLNALLIGTEENPGWLQAYVLKDNLTDLIVALDTITSQLWDQMLAPVHERLQALGARRVILMPQGGLGLLPLHAAWRMENGTRRYFMDDYIVRYAPSAYALDAAQRRLAARDGQRSALVVGVGEYQHFNDLPNTRPEAEAIAKLFDTSPLLDAQATFQAVLAGAPGSAYLHLACHGAFAWGAPLNSALVLGGDEELTLADIIDKLDLDAARLVTLSACETGITDVQESPDEYVGLPAGLMRAGAPGVVSSLWTVEDRSTALLMERFYRYHLEDNLPPAEALRDAQMWLRDVTRAELGSYYQSFYRMSADQAKAEFAKILLAGAPNDKPYASPYYWAAFTFNGV